MGSTIKSLIGHGVRELNESLVNIEVDDKSDLKRLWREVTALLGNLGLLADVASGVEFLQSTSDVSGVVDHHPNDAMAFPGWLTIELYPVHRANKYHTALWEVCTEFITRCRSGGTGILLTNLSLLVCCAVQLTLAPSSPAE
jgi:hypothetical protein